MLALCLLAALALGCAPSQTLESSATPRPELTPGDQALILRLQELHRQGEHETGIAEAEEYLELHPDAARVHYALGTLRGSAGDHSGAIADFDAELERDPEHVESLMGLAIAHTRLGELEASLGPLLAVRAAAPQRSDAAYQLGRNFSQLSRFDEARIELTEAARLGYGADAASELGILARRQGDLVGAEASFRRALSENPRHTAALLNLGQVLLRVGRADEGAALLRRQGREAELDDQLDFARDNSRIRGGGVADVVRLAKAYREKGRPAEAAATLEDLLQTTPQAVPAALELADLRLEAGDVESARRWSLSALMSDPENSGARFLLGLTRLYSGQRDEAESMLDTARRAARWSIEAHLRLGDAYLATGDLDAAQRAYKEARMADLRDARSYHALGGLALRQGDLRTAETLLREATQLDPEGSASWLLLALVLQQTHRTDDSAEALGAAVVPDLARLFSSDQADDALAFLDEFAGGSELRTLYRQLLGL